MQDGRLQAALAAGSIEIWDQLLETPSLVPPDCPVLVDTSPAADWDATLLPGPVVLYGTIEIWDQPEVFGPVWDQAAMALHASEIAVQGDDLPPTEAFFGPFLPEDEAIFVPMLAADALTLSAGMRIDGAAQDASVVAAAVVPVVAVAAPPQGHDTSAEMPAWQDGPQVEVATTTSVQVAGTGTSGAESLAVVSDLSLLPGAGPGLIWMLQKCGIASLEDLAAADAGTLMPRLGLVGQIADVQGWLRFAKQRVARAA